MSDSDQLNAESIESSAAEVLVSLHVIILIKIPQNLTFWSQPLLPEVSNGPITIIHLSKKMSHQKRTPVKGLAYGFNMYSDKCSKTAL